MGATDGRLRARAHAEGRRADLSRDLARRRRHRHLPGPGDRAGHGGYLRGAGHGHTHDLGIGRAVLAAVYGPLEGRTGPLLQRTPGTHKVAERGTRRLARRATWP